MCEHRTSTDGDVPDPLKMYYDKDCVAKFVEHTKDELRELYETFLQQPMTAF